jgi:hypothetical protein
MVSALVVHQKLAEKMSRVRTSSKTHTYNQTLATFILP